MLNFKKGSIFSRSEGNEDAYEEYEQEDQGGVLAVWGSPGSGKTTVVFVRSEIWRTRALWEAYWLPPMCPTA